MEEVVFLQILKYKLPAADGNVQIAWDATYLSFVEQDGDIEVFYLGNPQSEEKYTDTYRFVFRNTGDMIDDDIEFNYKFIGTFKTNKNTRHIFMRKLA
jgi:hypothetical protein